jgi:hypothetical protein
VLANYLARLPSHCFFPKLPLSNMADQPASPQLFSSATNSLSFSGTTITPSSSSNTLAAPDSSSSTNTFLLPASPVRGIRGAGEGSSPTVRRTVGQRPACLVNASVTYCGKNQIYAFGGFDRYTDEIYNHVLRLDLNTYQWQLVDNFGAIPGVRMGQFRKFLTPKGLLVNIVD